MTPSNSTSPPDVVAERLAAVTAYIADQSEAGWRVLCQALLGMGMPFQYIDSDDLSRHAGSVKLCGELYVGFDGLGMAEGLTGDGDVVACEWWRGKPRVLIWSDITEPDPQVIVLEDALETKRLDDDADVAPIPSVEPDYDELAYNDDPKNWMNYTGEERE